MIRSDYDIILHCTALQYFTIIGRNSPFSYLLLSSSHSLNAKPSDLPNPVTDWDGFYKTVSDLNDAELPVWNPMTNKLERWIDLKRLKVQYGKSGES